MKIAIITLPLHTNYGGILQAYALQTVLQNNGHIVDVLQDVHPWYLMPLVYLMRLYKRYIRKQIHQSVFRSDITQVHTQRFIRHYIHQHKVTSWGNRLVKSYDAFIVGSDQVWRPKYFQSKRRPSISLAFLSFTKDADVKRIAYAASFGSDENEYTFEQLIECSRLLQKFDAVSVREQSAVAICKERFHANAQHVLDPTMLLNSADYEVLVNKAETPHHTGNLMTYILDRTEETDAFIERICKQKELTAFRTNSRVEDCNAPLAERIQPPVESWLRGFMDAEYVITDSFHACVFSILFHKPFICIVNKQRGTTRFESLLALFELTDRLVTEETMSNFEDYSINWQRVEQILSEQRQCAHTFISTAL